MADAFATPEELNTFTNRSIDGAQAAMMLAQVSALIRAYCGWVIWPATEYKDMPLDGTGSVTLQLPALVVTAVNDVAEDGIVLVEGDDYEWSTVGVLRRVGRAWTRTLQGVVLTYTAGYDECPAEVQAVCLQAAARAVVSPSGVKSEQAGGLMVTYAIPGGLTEYEKAVLERHRVPQTP